MSRRHDDIRLLLPAYAMGVADDVEEAAVRGHLASCRACRRELQGIEDAAGALPLATAAATPPAELRARVLDAVDAAADAGTDAVSDAPVNTPPARRVTRLRRPSFAPLEWAFPLTAAAASLALVVVSVSLLWRIEGLEQSLGRARGELQAAQQQQDPSGEDPLDTTLVTDRAVEVEGTAALRRADAFVAVPSSGASAVLVIRDLPPPPDGRAWQAWSIDAGGRKRSVDVLPRGGAVVVVPVQIGAGDSATRAIAITIEPAGGSRQPTGVPVAYGELGDLSAA